MLDSEAGWSTIVGHEWAVELMIGALARGRLAHAYLLIGPRHIGKTVLARTFAQALNCLEGNSSPCLACRACQLIARDGHPDVRLIRPTLSRSGRTETLRIEQVRDLQKELALSPYEGCYRVAIFTSFEKASVGAANALLKTLEEPPDRVVLILTAESVDQLLPTIVSRCQVLTLRPLPLEKVEAALLLQWGAGEEQARQLAHFSGGRLGLAVRLLSNPQLLEQRREKLDDLEALLQEDRSARFKYVERMHRRGAALVRETLELWLGWWRDVMLTAGCQQIPVVNIDRLGGIRDAAARYDLEAASAVVRALQTALWRLDHNANIRLTVEVLMLTMPIG